MMRGSYPAVQCTEYWLEIEGCSAENRESVQVAVIIGRAG